MALIVWCSNKLIFNEIVFFYLCITHLCHSRHDYYLHCTNLYDKHIHRTKTRNGSQQVINNQGERKYYEQHNLKQNLAESLR